MGTFLGIISALAALAGVASSVYGGVKEGEATDKQNRFNKAQKLFGEKQMRRENAWARRGAMERALKGDPSKAFQQEQGPYRPDPYDPSAANIGQAVAGGVQNLAGYDWASITPKTKPASSSTPLPKAAPTGEKV